MNTFRKVFMQYMVENFEEHLEDLTKEIDTENLLSIALNSAKENGDKEMEQNIIQSKSFLDGELEEGVGKQILYTVLLAALTGFLVGKGINYYVAKDTVNNNKLAIQHKAEELSNVHRDKLKDCIKNATNELTKKMCPWLTSRKANDVINGIFHH